MISKKFKLKLKHEKINFEMSSSKTEKKLNLIGNSNLLKKLVILSVTFLLSSCLPQDPGMQCLNSFKSSLKDPDSGKVINFTPPKLSYSATNSYGARTQGNALCTKLDDKWVRDRHAEYLAVLNLSAEKLEKSNECGASGKAAEECTGGSTVLKLQAITLKRTDTEALHDESRNELGF